MPDWQMGGTDALKGAGIGASLGSVIPGLGSAIGGGIGGLAGGLYGLFGGGSNADAQQQQGFEQQQQLIAQLQGQANGTGPSVAQGLLAQALQQNQAASASAIGSQRGMNAGAGAKLILDQQAQERQQAAGQGATLRAQEMLGNQQLLAGVIGQSRGQSIPLAQQQSSQQNNMLGGLFGGAGANLASGAMGGGIGSGPRFSDRTDIQEAHGGVIPGGTDDSTANDKVHALLSPDEIVLPRSIANAPDAPERAREFVAALKAHNDRRASGGPRGAWARAHERKMSGGGKAGYETSDGSSTDIPSMVVLPGGGTIPSTAADAAAHERGEATQSDADAANAAVLASPEAVAWRNRPPPEMAEPSNSMTAAESAQGALGSGSTTGPGMLAEFTPDSPGLARGEDTEQRAVRAVHGSDGEMLAGQRQQIGGLKGEAAAAKSWASDQKAVMDEWDTKRQAMTAQYQQTAQDHQQRADAMFKELMDPKSDIKPGRFWEHASTDRKLNASIGMILGGLGAGMTGGPNVAVEMIDKAINRDLEAQRLNLGKKANGLALYMEQGRDMAQAHLLQSADMHDAAAAKLARAAMAYQGTKAAADAQVLIGQLRQKGVLERQQAMLGDFQIQNARLTQDMMHRIAMGGGSAARMGLELSFLQHPEKRAEHTVGVDEDVPTGATDANGKPLTQTKTTPYLANTPSAREETAKEMRSFRSADSALKDIEAFMKKNPLGGTPGGEEVGEAQAAAMHLKLNYEAMMASMQRQASPEVLKHMDEIAGDPTALFKSPAKMLGKLKFLRRVFNQHKQEILDTNTVGPQ